MLHTHDVICWFWNLSERVACFLFCGLSSCAVSAGILESDNVGSGVGTQGFRSMAVSSDGKYLAAGDCQGNLHIYNLHTSDYTCFQVDIDTYANSIIHACSNQVIYVTKIYVI